MAMFQRPAEQHASAAPAILGARQRCFSLSLQARVRGSAVVREHAAKTPVRGHRPDAVRAVFFLSDWFLQPGSHWLLIEAIAMGSLCHPDRGSARDGALGDEQRRSCRRGRGFLPRNYNPHGWMCADAGGVRTMRATRNGNNKT